MTEKDYILLLNDNQYREYIIPIFQFFEIYIEKECSSSKDELRTIQKHIIVSDVKTLISTFGKKLFKDGRTIIRGYTLTLQRYLLDFCKQDITDNNLERYAIKWKNVLLAYVNLSRVVPEDYKIQNYQVNNSPDKKTILAVGMLKNTEVDLVKVNEEIAQIQDLSIGCNNYLVIPMHGCVFQTFITKLKNIHIDYIHLAGHGDGSKIEFADAAVKYTTLKKYITSQYELCFLNCCNTYDFVERTPVPFSKKTVCYENTLSAVQAIDVSHVFYQSIFTGSTTANAWSTTKRSTDVTGYHLV